MLERERHQVAQPLAVERLPEAGRSRSPRSRRGARPAGRGSGRCSAPAVPISAPSRCTHGIRSSRRFQTSAEVAAGAQHAGDLGQRAVEVEPVEGLRADHGVDRAGAQRDLLGGGDAAAGVRAAGATRWRSIASSGSVASTRWPGATSCSVSLPVPAPSSRTSARGRRAGEPGGGLARGRSGGRGRRRRRPRRTTAPGDGRRLAAVLGGRTWLAHRGEAINGSWLALDARGVMLIT